MTEKRRQLRVEMDDRAEGSPTVPESGKGQVISPDSMLLSIVTGMTDGKKPAAETGVADAVDMNAEGKDDGDAQDAPRTSDETQSTPLTKKETASAMEKPLTVLIVEDTLELAEVIQATLERMNLTVFHAAHGNKALEKFHELQPEVILLDIGLPDMMGWKIMDAIKEHYNEMPGRMPVIIVITAYDDPANRLVGKLQGVHSYLIKPFTADEIERTVARAIGGVNQ